MAHCATPIMAVKYNTHMAHVWDRQRRVHTQARGIAQALREYFAGVMGGGTVTEADCWRYVNAFPIPAKAVPLLMKPLDESVVLAALARLKGGSSPAKDGIPVELYQAFPEVFVPRVLQVRQQFLQMVRLQSIGRCC